MSANNRRGFTLVELLVVVVIIGILVGLIMPAIMGAREAARQARCMNRLHELGVAAQGYVAAKEYYPGFQSTRQTTWAIELLPHLGRNDLWKGTVSIDGWRGYDGGDATPKPGQRPFVEVFTCPNDSRNEMAGQLSFAANDRLFTNHTTANAEVTPEYVAQQGGISQVVMIGERSAMTADDKNRVWYDGSWAAGDMKKNVAFTWVTTGTLGGFLGSGHPSVLQVVFCDGHGKRFPSTTAVGDAEFAALP